MTQADPQPAQIFEVLLKRVEGHPRYGPGMRQAVAAGSKLVLNYHTHGGPGGYCVSVCAVARDNPLQIFGQAPEVEELVHVREFGAHENECVPLCLGLGQALKEHYELAELPAIWLNGKPYPATGEAAAPGDPQ